MTFRNGFSGPQNMDGTTRYDTRSFCCWCLPLPSNLWRWVSYLLKENHLITYYHPPSVDVHIRTTCLSFTLYSPVLSTNSDMSLSSSLLIMFRITWNECHPRTHVNGTLLCYGPEISRDRHSDSSIQATRLWHENNAHPESPRSGFILVGGR